MKPLISTWLKGLVNDLLELPDVNEVMINGPHDIFLEQNGVMSRIEDKDRILTPRYLKEIATLAASNVGKAITKDTPMVSGTLPSGERIQLVIPPACDPSQYVICFRKPATKAFTMDDYINSGYFDLVNNAVSRDKQTADNDKLLFFKKNEMWPDFMKLMISSKKNILLSGATGSGKTGFLNMLLGFIGNQERLLTSEDSREVLTRDHDKKRNMINLLSSEKSKCTESITNSDLLKACLRLRPDRILLSEIRGEDAFVFFNSLHTGHSGSISTIHANSAEDIWIRLVNMMSMAPETGGLTKDDILEYCKSSLDVVMHCEKSNGQWRMLDVITLF